MSWDFLEAYEIHMILIRFLYFEATISTFLSIISSNKIIPMLYAKYKSSYYKQPIKDAI
jgi:hypothetical protein